MIRFPAFLAAALLTGVSTQAAVVHVNGLPDVDDSFNKATSGYMYLEGESATQGESDTFVDPLDASRTFYRTDANPNDFWAGPEIYDGARYAIRGADINFSNINTYWENLDTALGNGEYDVFIRAYSAPEGTQTFSMFAGTDRASVDNGTAFGSVTTTQGDVANWYKIGTINLTEEMDTFRLTTDTDASQVRFDTVLFTAVPEPASLSLLAAGSLLLIRRRSRS